MQTLVQYRSCRPLVIAVTMALALAPALGASATAPKARSSACDRLIARQIARRVARPDNARCWRVGPLALRMTAAEVAARLSAPDLTESVVDARAGPQTIWFYLFARPRAPAAAAPRGAPTPDVLELAFRSGALVKIWNDPPLRIAGGACQPGAKTVAQPPGAARPGFEPFQTFAGVRVNDPLASLELRFGRAPTANASGDFFSYWPTPIAFGVDPDRRTISGFSIAADPRASGSGVVANLNTVKDPKTCTITGYRLIGRSPAAA